MLIDKLDSRLANVWTCDDAKATWIQVLKENETLQQPDNFKPFVKTQK